MSLVRLTLAVCAAAACAAAPASAAAPVAETQPATQVADTTATLNGTVATDGSATTYHFAYGTTVEYGSQTPEQKVKGKTTRSVSATVSGLQPSTTYHYTLVATNADGTSTGLDATFTTPAAGSGADGITIVASRGAVPFRRPVEITGTVPGPGAAGVDVSLEENPYPYTAGFRPANQTVATDTNGRYRFVVLPEQSTRYRVVAKRKGRPTSGEVGVRVRVRVSLRVSDRTPRRGQRVRFSGKALPAHDGRRVRIQRRTAGGRWRTVARTRLRAAAPTADGTARSRFAKRIRIRRDGVYRVRVAPGDGDHFAGNSRRRRIDAH